MSTIRFIFGFITFYLKRIHPIRNFKLYRVQYEIREANRILSQLTQDQLNTRLNRVSRIDIKATKKSGKSKKKP